MSIKIANDVKNQGGNPSMVQGTFAQRPAAGQTGRLYLSTDTNVLYRDNGSSWDVFLSQTTIPSGLSPIGTAGQLIKVNAGATALEYFTSTYATTGGNQTFTGNNLYTGLNTYQDKLKLLDINNSKSQTFNMNTFGDGSMFITNQASTTILTLSNTGGLAVDTINVANGIGIGNPVTGTFASLSIDKNITGATTSYGVNNNGVIQSGVTTAAELYHTIANTAAVSFTLANLRHYQANQGTFGSGSTVTSQYGFVAASTLIGATNNYGFYGNIASGTNRWNFYANGTAANYFNGDVLIGSTTNNNSGSKLQVTGNISFQNIFNRKTSSYTLVLTDQNDIIEMNVATANNLTVPLNSTVAFPIGTEIAITQYGAGKTTIVATGGVTLRSAGGLLSIGAQYAMVTLVKVATDEWYVVGNLIA
jgi:hypothetical protein